MENIEMCKGKKQSHSHFLSISFKSFFSAYLFLQSMCTVFVFDFLNRSVLPL